VRHDTYDPRPDLTEDSTWWVEVLRRAEKLGYQSTRSLLVMLRCHGARIYRAPTGTLKIDYKTAARDPYCPTSAEEILEKALKPAAEKLAEVFEGVGE